MYGCQKGCLLIYCAKLHKSLAGSGAATAAAAVHVSLATDVGSESSFPQEGGNCHHSLLDLSASSKGVTRSDATYELKKYTLCIHVIMKSKMCISVRHIYFKELRNCFTCLCGQIKHAACFL